MSRLLPQVNDQVIDEEMAPTDAVAYGAIRTTAFSPFTNWNVQTTTAGAPAISDLSKTYKATPTLVKPSKATGNHWLFVVLILALVYFEWKKGNL